MSTTADTPPETPPFDAHAALQAEEKRVKIAISELDDALAQTNDPDADADHDFGEEGGEGAGAAVDRDRDVSLRAQLVDRLVSLEAAERRLEAGTFGICRTCLKPIAAARLEVLPAATECVSCAGAPLLTRRSR
jgi:DnaK suppressor protein